MKKEKDNEFKDVKYILTSSMRTKILISLFEGGKNLDSLRKDLHKSSATILHGLKELEKINYVKKENKNYLLTTNGQIIAINMMKLIENWYTINKNEIFWNTHCLNQIPEELMKTIYLLKDCECITSTDNDLSKSLTTYINLISESENIKITLPIYSEYHLETISKLLKDNQLKTVEIITNKDIYNSIAKNHYFKKELLMNENVTINTLKKDTNMFLTCNDKYMTLNLFYKDGNFDDSQLLISKNENGIYWGNKLFDIIKKDKIR